MNAFPLRQQFREVGVVDASVAGPSQLRHVDDQRLGRGVDGSATAVARCQSRRAGEGMSKTEVIRCLKRYVAREVFSALQNSAAIISSAA